MPHLRATYKFAIIILIGLLIFLSDFFELANPLSNEIILFAICFFKVNYFMRFVFRQIKLTAHKEFYFHEFISFIVVTILLVIVSYCIDYYCLFRIDPGAFTVIIQRNIATELISFFYFSISVFTTAGFGDVKPNFTTAQILVSSELMIAYFFTILVLANILLLRESFTRKNRM
ncbi:MAG: ion transporter [Chitinophagaceae bacterium]|nr:ion transporter [Chitinophagaceae bacterium]